MRTRQRAHGRPEGESPDVVTGLGKADAVRAIEKGPGLRLVGAVRPITLVEQIVEALVRAAAEGRILPGERLVEAEISRRFDVSRVPVREALRLLESQGIVTNAPYRGMRLMEVDARHLRQILVV